MTISRHIPENIKRASRAIGLALWVGNREQWFGLSIILRARLSDEQRAALAFQALRALDRDIACLTADLAIYGPEQEDDAA